MRVAVIYTGALRTIQKTVYYLQRNILLHQDVHVFACLQNDTTDTNTVIEQWIRSVMPIQSLEWFDINNYSEFVILREKNLAATDIPNRWKDYLRNSGSILEYLQLQLAYKQIYIKEQKESFQYDYIIRMRPDNIFAKPIDFHWLQWNEQDIELRLQKIYQQMIHDNLSVNHQSILRYFMSTLLDDQLISNIRNIMGEFVTNKRVFIPISPKDILYYLHHGSYILTFRTNNLYIVRRELFHMIPSIYSMYGLLKRPENDDYWFNAENQFQDACIYSGLAIHDYNTLFEDKCLYEYDETRYFDHNFQIINPMMTYCLVRS